LFCEKISRVAEESLAHAAQAHGFDFKKLQQEWSLDFYGSIRLINYLRYQIGINTCPMCEVIFESPKVLFDHLKESKHYGVKRDGVWRTDERFLCPINEDDPILCSMNNTLSDNEDGEQEIVVEPEDLRIRQERINELQQYISQVEK